MAAVTLAPTGQTGQRASMARKATGGPWALAAMALSPLMVRVFICVPHCVCAGGASVLWQTKYAARDWRMMMMMMMMMQAQPPRSSTRAACVAAMRASAL